MADALPSAAPERSAGLLRLLAVALVVVRTEQAPGDWPRVGPEALEEGGRWAAPCSHQYAHDDRILPGCTPEVGGDCGRVLEDGFLAPQEVATLKSMAERGMGRGAPGQVPGPTIMDVNSGWVLVSGAFQPTSIYQAGPLYSEAEYALYREVVGRLKARVEEAFALETLYFTAPTFITREVGSDDWDAGTMHDEYWHPHVDKNNTAHYDYSALVYLSSQDTDFEGGALHFFPQTSLDCAPFVDTVNPGPCLITGDPELEVAPRAGRVIIFGSGLENPHRVTKVTSGVRYVLSLWFTCDRRREMHNFLDGKQHVHFTGDQGQRQHGGNDERSGARKRAERKKRKEGEL